MAGLGLGNSHEILQERYEIQQRLGKKAGRQTLLALDKETQELVVIKLLTFSSDFSWDDLKLFEREAETLKALSHAAIPRYLDSFELDAPNGKGFAMVQSYIEAPSLEEHLKGGRAFSEGEVKQLAKALLGILAYLHRQKPPVIHRDIKPSNILLTNRSGNSVGQVYLVDFGSVQTLATQEGKTVTVVGTYGYMPPEQFGGRAAPASDLYSLGATLIALLTGAHPADLPQKDMRIQFEQAAHLSPGFTDWLNRMIEPSLERRFASAESALQALEQPWPRESAPLLLRQKNSVTTIQLLWNAVWRSTAMGALAGAAYGGIYGTAIFPLFGTYFGALFGGFLGVPLGLGNGLLVGLLTRLCFFPLTNARRHRRIVGMVSTLLCTAAASIGFALLDSKSFPSSTGAALIYMRGIPALIAGLAMGLISQRIARWYEQKSRRQKER
jgi:eukaryotic-like serine/threonine-protein kinase